MDGDSLLARGGGAEAGEEVHRGCHGNKGEEEEDLLGSEEGSPGRAPNGPDPSLDRDLGRGDRGDRDGPDLGLVLDRGSDRVRDLAPCLDRGRDLDSRLLRYPFEADPLRPGGDPCPRLLLLLLGSPRRVGETAPPLLLLVRPPPCSPSRPERC